MQFCTAARFVPQNVRQSSAQEITQSDTVTSSDSVKPMPSLFGMIRELSIVTPRTVTRRQRLTVAVQQGESTIRTSVSRTFSQS